MKYLRSQGGRDIVEVNAMKKNSGEHSSIEKTNKLADINFLPTRNDLLKQLADKYNTQKRGLMQKSSTRMAGKTGNRQINT